MVKKLKNTPKKDGFRMPGEFEPHDVCWMVWPERTDNWRMGGKPAQEAFVEVAETIAKYENVTMCVSQSQYEVARGALSDEVRVIEMSNNDSWMRDIGPTFLINDDGEVRGVDWRFNAWGWTSRWIIFPMG